MGVSDFASWWAAPWYKAPLFAFALLGAAALGFAWLSRPLSAGELPSCARCAFEQIAITRHDGLRVRRRINLRIGRDMAAIRRLAEGMHSRRVDHVVSFRQAEVSGLPPDGSGRRNVLGDVPGRFDVAAIQRLSDEFPGGVLHLDFVETVTHGNLPGENFGWMTLVPGTRFGAVVESDRPLAVRGDLVEDGAGTYRYRPSGHGYFAFSTLQGMGELADAYRAAQDEVLGAGELFDTGPGTDEEVLGRAWRWLRANLEYEDISLVFTNSNAPAGLDVVMQRRKADCKAYAAILIGMLRKQGIPASAVLVETGRRKRRRTDIPTNEFDHVIIYLPRAGRFVDPTLSAATTMPTGGLQAFDRALDTGTGNLMHIEKDRTW